MGMNAQSGRPLAGIAHLRQSIRDILTTPIGTRVMRRDYGSHLFRLVDAPMRPGLDVQLYAAAAEALRRWEPRLRLSRVQVTATAVAHATLSLEGVYLPTGQAVRLGGIEV